MHYTVDADNNITAHESTPAAQDGTILFATEKQFAKATAEWPISRFTGVWNSFAGVAGPFGDLKPVKKFENRAKAVARIWAAIQVLGAEVEKAAAESAAPAPRPRKPAAKTERGQTHISVALARNMLSSSPLRKMPESAGVTETDELKLVDSR